jgi:ribosomal protein S18 acetylase RimI-like enzyme
MVSLVRRRKEVDDKYIRRSAVTSNCSTSTLESVTILSYLSQEQPNKRMETVKIIECGTEHLSLVANLFDDYRIFYEQPSDPDGVIIFLKNNLIKKRSRIFLLFDDGQEPVAFAQLYPSYCSIAMEPFYYLSDLYVDKSARRRGYAHKLMTYLIEKFGAESIHRLTLETATTNLPAQSLYESLGYVRERVFVTYHKIF